MDVVSQVLVTTSWDDGHPMDIKLAGLLSDYGIKGTFYVAPNNRERAVMGVADLRALNKQFEIGAHTLTHPDLRRLNHRQLDKEIAGSKLGIESALGTPVRMFCYPKGKYNRRVLRAVASAGFIGARTTKMFRVALGEDPWRMPTTAFCYPLPMWVWHRHCLKTRNSYGLRELWRMGTRRSWSQVACGFFEAVLRQGGIWHLWGHSWEIEEHDLWDDLREVLETVSRRQGVMYLTNGEVVQMILKRRLR